MTTEIAIIGLCGRFPGARDLDELWSLLRDGRSGIRMLEPDEIDPLIDAATLRDPRFIPAFAGLDDVELFDAGFFGISPGEAEMLDPQQRLFLESAWQALEHAGWAPERFPGRIGVYAGASASSYLLWNVYGATGFMRRMARFEVLDAILCNDKDHLPMRVSYKLNLRGPSVAVQSACSTSLVAVHHACQSLLSGESDMALAGGVSIRLPHKAGYVYEDGSVLSPDGRCRPFDAKAAGTVFGSGVGVVVLRRLEDALRDRDVIHAVIKGTAINNDGADKVGYTAPCLARQAEVIAEALAVAGVDPHTVGYVEAHGTGTALGDPIEMAALAEAFGPGPAGTCAVGSVKGNIGHLDAASGVAGLIKAVLMLSNGELVPSLHFERLNPRIELGGSPFYVNAQRKPWPAGAVRRAGVSSFGMGGTNAHVVLEEPPRRDRAEATGHSELFLVSARTESAVDIATDALAAAIDRPGAALDPGEVACTLQERRAFRRRRAVLVKGGAKGAAEALRQQRVQPVSDAPEAAGPLLWVFPGQGCQFVGMGRELHDTEEVFRDVVQRCAEVLHSELGFDVRAALWASRSAELGETWLTQPALFTVQVALARQWSAWGVEPSALVGHSLGEWVAACVAGVFSLEAGLRLIAARGRAMQACERGVMLAVSAAEQTLVPRLPDGVELSAVNGPLQCVVGGQRAALEQLARALESTGISTRLLDTSHAFHTRSMTPARDLLLAALSRETLRAPSVPLVSTVTGARLTDAEATSPSYWAEQLLAPVRFGAALESLARDHRDALWLEMGPRQTLRGPVRAAAGTAPVICAGNATAAASERAALLEAAGALWEAGVPVRPCAPRQRVALPSRPFERRRYWIDPVAPGQPAATTRPSTADEPAAAPEAARVARHRRPALDTPHVAPRDQREAAIAAIWSEVLGIADLGVDDNFLELGGDSLIALKMLGRVRDATATQLSVRDFFGSPTVAGIARATAGADPAGAPPAIPLLDRGGALPASSAQVRLLFLHQLNPTSAVYNLPVGVRIRGSLDCGALQAALDSIVERHESLRTRIAAVDGRPAQLVSATGHLPLEWIGSHAEPDTAEREARVQAVEATGLRPFDLARGPLARAAIARTGAEEHTLVLTLHHIVSDAWSMGILVRELSAAYLARVSGRAADAPRPPVQYADYCGWQRDTLVPRALERHLPYWTEQLAALPSGALLEPDLPRPAVRTAKGARFPVALDRELSARLVALGRSEGATLFMTLLAAFKVLLFRYSGAGDLVVGSPVANRDRTDLEGVVGLFVNMLLLRTRVDGTLGFREIVRRAREAALQATAHQELPFEQLIDVLRPERSLSMNPLFQVSFQLQNVPIAPVSLPGLELQPFAVDTHTSKFDLSLDLWERADGISGWFEYSTELFEPGTVQRMAAHLSVLVRALLDAPDSPVAGLSLLTEEERRTRERWAHGPALELGPATLPERLAAMAARYPDRVAVSCGERRLTFAQLEDSASRLARRLIEAGAAADSRVGLCVARSIQLPVALLAIWKAGAAYVPLDSSHPAERLRFLIEDAGLSLVVGDEVSAAALPAPGPRVVRVDHEEPAPSVQLPAAPAPDALAYVIYTSGTTGRPKGVMVEHGSLAHTVAGASTLFELEPGDVMACVSAATFDIFLFELLAPLLAGASVEIAVNPLDVAALCRLPATLLHAVPSLMERVVSFVGEHPDSPLRSSVRRLFVGGDAVSAELVARMGEAFPRAATRVLYGPTEATIICASYRVDERPVPGNAVGAPLAGAVLRVCDPDGNDLPVGVAGEILIGGAGVARGYLGRPELTAERFAMRRGARHYRSGDIARYLPDGTIQFLGRRDEQVKIRGYRIELGEVEAALRRQSAVRDAAVVAATRASGDKELAAAVVLSDGTRFDALLLKAHLRALLPEYMIPARIAEVDALPLSAHGKLDRASVAALIPGEMASGGAGLSPRDDLERSIASVWRDVLGTESVGIDASFFDVGGNSLLLLEAHARLARLGGHLTVVDLFQSPTIRELARRMRAASRDGRRLGSLSVERAARQVGALNLHKRKARHA